MKKAVLNLGFSLMTVLMFSACHDDSENRYVSYGVIRNMVSVNNYEIQTDRGNTLIVKKSQTSQQIEDGKRVMVNFEVLSGKSKNGKECEIEVKGFYNLLSKPLVRESYILQNEAVRRDSIGDDPFTDVYAWFGGDYININFGIYYAENSTKKHLINLVYDDTQNPSDTLYLTLYQNAYGEVAAYNDMYLRKGVGRCSFKLSDILPEGVDEKPVKLMWKEYRYNFDVVKHFDTGVFKKGNYATEKSVEKSETGYDNTLTVI